MVQIMAVVNLTPDSFFAPSRVRAAQAQDRIRELRAAGADIIDLGAVSTRPGAKDVSLREEWRRLAPVVRAWDRSIPLSVDTTRAEIVRRVYDCAGPFLVNDISANDFIVVVDFNDTKDGRQQCTLHLRTQPEGISHVNIIPEKIEYIIEQSF